MGVECTPKRSREERRNDYVIPLSSRELVRVHNLNDDVIVMSIMIAKHHVKKNLVDSGISSTSFLMMFLFKWICP